MTGDPEWTAVVAEATPLTAVHDTDTAGATPADLPVFDLLRGLEAFRSAARMLSIYRQQGRTDACSAFRRPG